MDRAGVCFVRTPHRVAGNQPGRQPKFLFSENPMGCLLTIIIMIGISPTSQKSAQACLPAIVKNMSRLLW